MHEFNSRINCEGHMELNLKLIQQKVCGSGLDLSRFNSDNGFDTINASHHFFNEKPLSSSISNHTVAKEKSTISNQTVIID